jgi:hypothetical protein
MKSDADTNQEFRRLVDPLRRFSFKQSLTPSESAACTSALRRPKNLYFVLGRWFLKTYTGAAQRTWFVCGASDFEKAARIADMVILRFWRFRRSAWKVPTDDDFNITLERAKLDAEHETDFTSTLLHVEGLLIEKGLILSEPKTERGKYQTAKGEINFFKQEFFDRFATFEKFSADEARRLRGDLAKAFAAQQEQLKALKDEIADLRSPPIRHVLPPTFGPLVPAPPIHSPSVPGIQALPNPVTDNPGPGYTAPVIGDPPSPGPQCGDNSAPVTSLFINSETETDKPSV